MLIPKLPGPLVFTKALIHTLVIHIQEVQVSRLIILKYPCVRTKHSGIATTPVESHCEYESHIVVVLVLNTSGFVLKKHLNFFCLSEMLLEKLSKLKKLRCFSWIKTTLLITRTTTTNTTFKNDFSVHSPLPDYLPPLRQGRCTSRLY